MSVGVVAFAINTVSIDEIVDGDFDVVSPIVTLKMDASFFRSGFAGSCLAGRFFNGLFGTCAGREGKNHQQSEENSQNFFHSDTPYVFCHLRSFDKHTVRVTQNLSARSPLYHNPRFRLCQQS